MNVGAMLRHLKHENQIALLAAVAGVPGMLLGALWAMEHVASVALRGSVLVLVGGWWMALIWSLRERLKRPLQNICNLLGGIREEDFSIRAARSVEGDCLGGVYREINSLTEVLKEQRLGALEASALLKNVMAQLDVAILAFDQDRRLRLINRAGERLLGRPEEQLLGKEAAELGVDDCLDGEPARMLDRADRRPRKQGLMRSLNPMARFMEL